MDKNIYNGILFSYYKNLLTDKQKVYSSYYYEHNLTIVEIANEFLVSKESVFDLLKRVNKKLELYESSLKLFEKSKKVETILKKNNISSKIIDEIVELI